MICIQRFVFVSGLDAAHLNSSESACALMQEQKPDVTRLDLRVARVLDVRKHPDSASLYVQEVELGEPAPRTVVSGLTNHVPPEQVDSLTANFKMFLISKEHHQLKKIHRYIYYIVKTISCLLYN